MIRRAKGFIFDMDGTLLSLPVDWPRVRAELANRTGRTEFQPVFETLNVVLKERPELRRGLFGMLDEYEAKAEPSATLHEGSREVIRSLSTASKLALVTMQGSRVRERLLRRFGLDGGFQAFVTREDSLDRGEQVEMALRALSLSKDEGIFVGDRLNDLNAAKRIGMEFVFIRSREDAAAEANFPNMNSFWNFISSELA